MTRCRRALARSGRLFALLAGLLPWAALPAHAEGEKIPVHVLVTHLSNQGGGIDAPALDLDRRLSKQIRYKSMKVIKDRRMLLTLDEVSSFELPNGRKVRMRPIHKGESGVLMAVDVEGAAKLDARVKSHHPVVIRAGPYDGGSLVVSLELED